MSFYECTSATAQLLSYFSIMRKVERLRHCCECNIQIRYSWATCTMEKKWGWDTTVNGAIKSKKRGRQLLWTVRFPMILLWHTKEYLNAIRAASSILLPCFISFLCSVRRRYLLEDIERAKLIRVNFDLSGAIWWRSYILESIGGP